MCRHREVVILADADGPGRAGAERLAKAIFRTSRSVKIIEPLSGKDMREWDTDVDTLKSVISAAELWAA